MRPSHGDLDSIHQSAAGALLGGAGAHLPGPVRRLVCARWSDGRRAVRVRPFAMKRSASLDFLRGAAAFADAVPHYLTANAPFSPGVESVAVAAVEVFFVLSGFVLAPQIVDWVVGHPWRNLGVFLARRWMRTIPPYVAALVVVGLMTGNLFTADTLRYLFYVENLFRSANVVDFYPVAWSLAVEEWFYLLFAPLLFLIARALGRTDRGIDVAFAVLFVLIVVALRAFAAPSDWDLDVRRVTLFRIDSIVWGFLLYLVLERTPPPWKPSSPRQAVDFPTGRADRGSIPATEWPPTAWCTRNCFD